MIGRTRKCPHACGVGTDGVGGFCAPAPLLMCMWSGSLDAPLTVPPPAPWHATWPQTLATSLWAADTEAAGGCPPTTWQASPRRTASGLSLASHRRQAVWASQTTPTQATPEP